MLNLDKLWIASGNTAKTRELLDFSQKYFSASDIRARAPKGVEEDKDTFLGNAKLKARALAAELIAEGQSGRFAVLADDSGLCIDILGGAPGVRSRRYNGASPVQNNLQKVLQEVNALTREMAKRTAQYRCGLFLIEIVDGRIVAERSAEGVLDGLIALQPKGSEGYAYDPIFLNPESGFSYAEIPYAEKQKDSHRARAFLRLVDR